MRSGQTWLRIVPIGFFLCLLVLFAYGLTRDPERLPSAMINRPLPAFELPTLYQATSVSDQDFVGTVSLINIFGSWCAACLYEHPVLMRLSRRRDIRLIGVNWRDDRQAALNWLGRHGDPYSVIIVDADSRLAIDLGVSGAPESFIIDHYGRIRFKWSGPITDTVLADEIEPVLAMLLAEDKADGS